jgi:hypothetical protein
MQRTRILSKSAGVATALAAVLLAASCSINVPWRNERADEVNLGFTLVNNLVMFEPTVRIDNKPGRFLLGTAARQTVIDDQFPLAGRDHHLQIQEKETLRIAPVRLDLQGVADAIVGADAWRNQTISIDYRTGLVSYRQTSFERSQMTIFRFRNEPTVNVSVDGRELSAIVDTTSPDTLVLPGSALGRGTVRVSIAGTDFGATDVQFANVTQARIGNRLLSRFLVSIDYGRRTVGLWRDPRIPL